MSFQWTSWISCKSDSIDTLLLSKHEVEARLKALGAFYVTDADDVHEVWGTAWGFHIWVPIAGPFAGRLHEDDLIEIEDELRRSKPRFP